MTPVDVNICPQMSTPESDPLDPILAEIAARFYGGETRAFYADRIRLQSAVTWPATWLRSRGVVWPMERYEATLRTLFKEIERHREDKETYFPAYLLRCLRGHFGHHSDKFCAEAKSLRDFIPDFRNAVDASIGNKSVAREADERQIEVMAAAHSLVARPKRAEKKSAVKKSDEDQGELFSP